MKYEIEFNQSKYETKKKQLNRAIERVNETIPYLKNGKIEITLNFIVEFSNLQVDQIRDEIRERIRKKELKKLFIEYGLPENTVFDSEKHGLILDIAKARTNYLYFAFDVFKHKINTFSSNPLSTYEKEFINEKYIRLDNDKVIPVDNIDGILKTESTVFVNTKKELEIFNQLSKMADELNKLNIDNLRIDFLFKRDESKQLRIDSNYFKQII